MTMNRKEKTFEDQNEFLRDMIESLEDVKAGRVKDIKCLEKRNY